MLGDVSVGLQQAAEGADVTEDESRALTESLAGDPDSILIDRLKLVV
jgi:hypothetical protein